MKNRLLLTFIIILSTCSGLLAQSLKWEKGLSTTDTFYEANFVKHDDANNIYTVGLSFYAGVYICKHDSNGNYQWHKYYAGPDSTHPKYNVTKMDVDKLGNTYISGNIDHYLGPDTGFVTKIDASGNVAWNYYDTAFNRVFVRDMVLTPDNHVGILITKTIANGLSKAYIKSLDQVTGSLIWSHQQGIVDTAEISNGALVYGNYIGCDANSNLYIAASDFHLLTSTLFEVFAKYSSAGILSWETKTATLLHKSDIITAFSVDYLGNMYAAVKSFPGPQQLMIKIDGSTGVYKYAHSFTYPGSGSLVINNLQADSLGNSYFAGTMVYLSNPTYCIAGKIDTAGSLAWFSKVGDTQRQNIYSAGFLKNNNTYYTAGQINDTATHAGQAVIVTRYDSEGNIVWSAKRGYHYINHVFSTGRAMDVDKSGNIIVAGMTTDTTTFPIPPDSVGHFFYQEYLAKWGDPEASAVALTNQYIPALIYPDPAKDVVYVSLPLNKPFSWDVYNMEGRRMTSGNVTISNHDLKIITSDWPAGNYIFHATGIAEQIGTTAKFMIVR